MGNVKEDAPKCGVIFADMEDEPIKDDIKMSVARPVSYECQAMEKFNPPKDHWMNYTEYLGEKDDKKAPTEYGLITVIDDTKDGYEARGLTPEHIAILTAMFSYLCKGGKLIGDKNGNILPGEDNKPSLSDITYLMTGVRKRRHRKKEKFNLDDYETESKIDECIREMQTMLVYKTSIILPKGKDVDKCGLENIHYGALKKVSKLYINKKPKLPKGYLPSTDYLLNVTIHADTDITSLDEIVYEINRISFLFLNAERVGRVMRIPLENLRVVSEKINRKMITIAIRDFLFYRIAKLCNGTNGQRMKRIDLNGLYEYVAVQLAKANSEKSRGNMKTQIRKLADAILKAIESVKELSDEDIMKLQEQGFTPQEIELCKHYIFGKQSYLVSHRFNRADKTTEKAGRVKARRGQPYTSINLQFDAETEKSIADKERKAKEAAQRKAAQAAKKAAKQAIKEAEAAKAELKKGTENHE